MNQNLSAKIRDQNRILPGWHQQPKSRLSELTPDDRRMAVEQIWHKILDQGTSKTLWAIWDAVYEKAGRNENRNHQNRR